MLQINPLSVFLQFGFVEQRERTGDGHACGRCPLCGKDQHFLVNTISLNKTWDCKRCGHAGGFKKFLESVVEVGQKHFTGEVEAALVASRGISAATFKKMGVGFLPAANAYIIPVWANGGELVNVKIYNFKSMKNTATCKSAMYGLWLLPENTDKYNTVYIAEGEWDAMTMIECLDKLKIKDAVVIGVPGAGTFRPETTSLLSGKDVFILYDNDLAGNNGGKKVVNLLGAITSKTYLLKWPKGSDEGKDIRDVYTSEKNNPKKVLDFVKANSTVQILENSDQSTVNEGAELPQTPAKEVYAVFKKWLHMPSTDMLDVMFGVIIANRLPGDPLWMFIVAPPGATKTEPLMSLSGSAHIETLSSLTPHTLISGANTMGGDPSLIPKLDGKNLIVKDFTTIFGLPQNERDEIFSILRDAYDGECSKPFGNGVFRRYKSKFGILAAVTPMIELFTEEHAALGERFLRWRNHLPASYEARKDFVRKALSNVTHEVDMRSELNAISKKVLLARYETVPVISESMKERIIDLAQWVAIMRGIVNRDKYSKEITHKSFSELGTRLSKQLYKLMIGILMFRQETKENESVYDIVLSVAKDSVSSRYMEMVTTMQGAGALGSYATSELQEVVGLPNSTCATILGNLEMLGAVTRTVNAGKAMWSLTRDTIHLLTKCRIK